MAQPWEPGTFWNVNFPHLTPDEPDPDVVFCPLDSSPLPLSYRVDADQAIYSGDLRSESASREVISTSASAGKSQSV